MASKRHIRRKACAGKQRHETQLEAVAHSASLRHKGEIGQLNSYRCVYCGGYHVGHTPHGRLRRRQ